ncbi:hypothetical protein B0H10DRAFT_2227575 [Mycena sp. CBHHK59/15]|nr:hypothetical protein B0H10DRAFT_2227575 [Mycena sp. CBHHK59/15]
MQGLFPANFWTNVALRNATGASGGVTGCIRTATLDRLNPGDDGGQYDSSGGATRRAASVSGAYRHYVELIEPRASRACIRCCDDPVDCPTTKGQSFSIGTKLIAARRGLTPSLATADTSGCPNVIPGNYFDCD